MKNFRSVSRGQRVELGDEETQGVRAVMIRTHRGRPDDEWVRDSGALNDADTR